ncbi:MAG TPA: hypothetical protein VFZ61_30040 [Polyangiales bacterium]
MLRAPRQVLSALLLCAAACGGDMTVGRSEFENVSGDPDGGVAGLDAEAGTRGPDAPGDELARIAQELEGSWSLTFGDRTITLFFTYGSDRRGTLAAECQRGGVDCSDVQDAGFSFPFPPWLWRAVDGKFYVLEQRGSRVLGLASAIAGSIEFVVDPARQSLTLVGATFIKDDPSRTPSEGR